MLGQLHARGANSDIKVQKQSPWRKAGQAVAQKSLDDVLCNKTLSHTHGVATRNQGFLEQLEERRSGHIPLQPPPTVACQKGQKDQPSEPNQDNYSVTHFVNGFTLACVADGHGKLGHVASKRAVQAVPYFLYEAGLDQELVVERVEEALIQAFESANADVIALLGSKGMGVRASGTTMVAAFWKGANLWTANLGDSRCLVATQVDKKVVFATTDHKPDSPHERARIEAAGGDVRVPVYADDSMGVARVFLHSQHYPGLAISRTMGDYAAKSIGVIPTPEVNRISLDASKKPFVLLATDGVWEFLETHLVAATMATTLMTSTPSTAIRQLQAEAWAAWKEVEGVADSDEFFFCDDLTSLLIQLS